VDAEAGVREDVAGPREALGDDDVGADRDRIRGVELGERDAQGGDGEPRGIDRLVGEQDPVGAERRAHAFEVDERDDLGMAGVKICTRLLRRHGVSRRTLINKIEKFAMPRPRKK